MAKDLGIVTAYGYAVSKGYTGTEDEFATLMAAYGSVGQQAVDAMLAAQAAQSAAEGAQASAETAATQAAGSATTASGAASNATQKAGEASTYASNAGASASQAQTYASNAEQSATAASGSASAASGSASAAAGSASAAHTSETNAAESETAAAESAAQAKEAARTLTIDPTLTQPGQAAEAKATGERLADLKSQINELLPIDLANGTTYTSGKGVQYDNGNLRNSTGANATDYIDITGITSITYTRIALISTSSVVGIAFYDATKTYISGVRVIPGVAVARYVMSTEDVPANAVYVRMTQYTSLGDIHLYDTADYNSKVYQRIDALEQDVSTFHSDVSDINTYLGYLSKNGYFKLNLSKWENGGYLSYNSPDSRNYRVRYTEPLTFDHDVYIISNIGFYAVAWKSDGTYFAASSSIKVPAYTTFKLYVRRINEDFNEVADVNTFANAINLSTALSPIELYKPTFTDISMFERVGVCGDSYANGGGIISGIRSLTWGKNLERQAGITVDIYAKSGQNITEWNTDTVHGLPALLAGPECGLYWLQHGINGTGSAGAIGTPEDMETTPHPATFYGQYAEALEQIKTTFPNARIIIATIIGTSFDLYETSYSAVNTAIRNIAEYCGVMLVDVGADDFYRSEFYSVWNRSNHPTAMQCAGIAMANRRLISKCIQDNPSYFVNYGSAS